MGKPRVVIIGGGFAGLNAAKGLKKANFDLILIDKTNHHLFQPLLYQVATAALSPSDIAYPLREIFRKQKNCMVIMGEVTAFDKENNRLLLKNGDVIGYDFLIIASGARHSYFGHDEWETFAPGLKTVVDALQIRERILSSFEKAERLNDPELIHDYLNFVVIGGGPTGVEMAGAIAEIAKTTLRENFRKIKPETAQIFLIEALDHILPSYSKKLSQRAEDDLKNLGVQVLNGKKVTSISNVGVDVDGMLIRSKNVIWAAGNQASSLLKTLNVPLDRQGRIIVEPDLSILGHPEIFVIGDAAHCKNRDGSALPATATVAIQQGKHIAKALQTKQNRSSFSFFDKGSMATIGKGKAIASIGKLEFHGIIAWFIWGVIHIAYLIGFRSKFAVIIEWISVFITGKRGVRVLHTTIDEDLIAHKRDSK